METVLRASELVGWKVVAVATKRETEGWDGDYEYGGIGLLLERDGELKKTWLWAAPEAGAQFAWVVLGRDGSLISQITDLPE